jgi:hypothetical protein
MRLVEFVTPDQAQDGYYDPQEDKVEATRNDDTRKGRVTLKDLNRLKKMRAQKKLEALKQEDLRAAMFREPEQPGM